VAQSGVARTVSDLPARIGPVEFGMFGACVGVRCPSDLDPLMLKTGGPWEPGSRRWLIEAQADQAAGSQPAPRGRSAVAARWAGLG
jgi:hypothetical protein